MANAVFRYPHLMRRAALLAAFALCPHGAAALDCAANPFQRAVCALPEALAEWQKMEADLAAIQGPARPSLLATQDRWLAMMGSWDVEATRAYFAQEDTRSRLESFRQEWGWWPKDVADAEVAERLYYHRKTLSALPAAWADFEAMKASLPGATATLATGCYFVEPEAMPSGYSNSFCGGVLRFTLHGRICTISSYGYGDRINTVYAVDDIRGGKLSHRGNCDWNGLAPTCPDAVEGEAESDAHWDSTESRDVLAMREDFAASTAKGPLSSNDPEALQTLEPYPDDWFTTCLTTPDYPPPDQVWAGDGPKP